MAKARGLTRNITRKQALSYERVLPNPIGVTHLASVNGRRRARRAKVRGASARRSGGSMKRKARKHGRRRARRNAPPMVSSSSYLKGHERIFGPKKKKPTKASRKAAAARRAAATAKRLGRKYGPFTSMVATVGGRKVPTYLYRGKRGKASKIPLWAILGGKSKKAFEASSGETKVARRIVAAKKRRDRAARVVQLHGDAFTPNRRGRRRMRVIPYETWSANMSTKKRRRSRKKARKSTHRRKVHRTRKHTRRSAARRSHGRKRKSAKRSHTRARRNKGRRRHKRPVVLAGTITMNRGRRRRHRRARRNDGAPVATPNRRRHHRRRARRNAKRRNLPLSLKGVVRMNRRHRRHHRFATGFRRNPDFMGELKSALKVGVVVGAGFFVHKALSKLVSDKILGSVTALGEWKGLVTGLLTAGLAIPLARKVAPQYATSLGVGMAVSLVQTATMKILEKVNAPTIAGYLAGYPNEGGRAYHGMGEYIMANQGISGFGAADLLAQAAAGYGASPMLAQAAAGYGAPPMLAQAAAGVGDASSMGEYIVQGASGIGEYEQVPTGPFSGSGYGATNEGIYPDLSSAERALSVAEAAAGVGGMGDLPFMSTLNPTTVAQPVQDAPSGSRAGILEGGDGIFGS